MFLLFWSDMKLGVLETFASILHFNALIIFKEDIWQLGSLKLPKRFMNILVFKDGFDFLYKEGLVII